jgi:hypothetical protein
MSSVCIPPITKLQHLGTFELAPTIITSRDIVSSEPIDFLGLPTQLLILARRGQLTLAVTIIIASNLLDLEYESLYYHNTALVGSLIVIIAI